MLINVIIGVLIICSFGGIVFIIFRKTPLLINLDLSQTAQEIAAKTKKDLLKKKIIRQIECFKSEFRIKYEKLKGRASRWWNQMGMGINKTLEIFKKIVKIIKNCFLK